MQIASRQPIWCGNGRGTYVEVEMTPETGLYIQLFIYSLTDDPARVEWGDGTASEIQSLNREPLGHRYTAYGRYSIRLRNISLTALRWLDGQKQYRYDGAVISYIDHDGIVTDVDSGGFKGATNLKLVSLPFVMGIGQRAFANCTGLEVCNIPICTYLYDGAFEHCRNLTKLELSGGTLMKQVFFGCTRLREIRFSHMEWISADCFAQCPALDDIYIESATVAQVTQAPGASGIASEAGAKFPWGAKRSTRFHCADGIVLESSAVIRH